MLFMRWRVINLLLAPVFTLTLVCSIAKLEITAPRLAKKMTSPCPFHPQMNMPSEQPETGDSPERTKTCLNCLTHSILTEKSGQTQADMYVAALVPVAGWQTWLAAPGEMVSIPVGWAHSSGPPSDGSVPLRI